MRHAEPAAGRRWPHGVEVKVWHHYFGSEYGPEEVQAILAALQQEHLTNGPQTVAFEEEFAAFCGTPHAVATSNCTTALRLAAQLCGLGPGDEVITTPLTFIATSQAVLACGATPVFADVDPRTFNLDPASVAACITPRTRAIFLTHLFGQCCEMDPIDAVAREHGLHVVEDAANAIGAAYRGRRAGSLGDVAAFSFHSSKNMTTLGEGGMLTTRHQAWASKARLLRTIGVSYADGIERPDPLDYWLPLPYEADDPDGYLPNNYRMHECQAAVGRAQLRKVERLNERRRQIAHRYTEAIREIPGLTPPYEHPDCTHVYYLYTVLVDPARAGFTRDDLMRVLFREFGVHTITGYPPSYWLRIYRKRGYARGLCPAAERAYAQMITLPIHPRLTDEEIAYVTASVGRAAARLAGRRGP
ncbi:MAG: DegT/DnrJ/EryC1/StrS family aminotransferase [Armatimonadota bacterium]|nr:DegT/DnrJ/EryC1/StrS family aminotransferase [Armatimonadota bacterium]MDR7518150.1 DegT/DnrJ/EryC1/StrS family aminotransferase [Armatimonadota bacterium]MDR7550567.1 DegT/DnrJ/EryC1/StrS family aminotransferase [Armatimonadota bacterium]